MKRLVHPFQRWLFPAALFVCAAGAAADERGLFFGVEAGVALPGDIDSTRINVGVQTNCDQWLGAATLNDGTAVPLPADQCRPAALPGRANGFHLDAGWFLAGQVGYRLGAAWAVEGEFLHGRREGERRALNVPGDPKQQEFTERSETIGDVASNGLFANVFHHFRSRGNSRFKAFAGAGVGVLSMDVDYKAASIRTSDRDALLALGRNPNAAGTQSLASAELSDRLGAWQVILGFDYALNEARSLSVKARYVKAFDEFEDRGNAWRPLRSHDSTVAPGGAPILYDIEADEPAFWAVSVGLRFKRR